MHENGNEQNSLTKQTNKTQSHYLSFRFHSDNFLGIVVHETLNGFVEHVGATINSAQTSKSLRHLTQTIKWVDVRRVSITQHRFSVQSNAFDGLQSGFVQVAGAEEEKGIRKDRDEQLVCQTQISYVSSKYRAIA